MSCGRLDADLCQPMVVGRDVSALQGRAWQDLAKQGRAWRDRAVKCEWCAVKEKSLQ